MPCPLAEGQLTLEFKQSLPRSAPPVGVLTRACRPCELRPHAARRVISGNMPPLVWTAAAARQPCAATRQYVANHLLTPPCSQGPYMGCFQATAASGERLFCVDLNFKIALGAPDTAAGAQEAAGAAAQLAAQ